MNNIYITDEELEAEAREEEAMGVCGTHPESTGTPMHRVDHNIPDLQTHIGEDGLARDDDGNLILVYDRKTGTFREWRPEDGPLQRVQVAV